MISNTNKTQGKVMTGWLATLYDLRAPINGVYFVNKADINLIDLQKGDQLLDVGCGTAKVIAKLHQKYGNDVSYYGIDPSSDMIRVAGSKFPAGASVKLMKGVAEELPYQNNFFDWVLSSLTFHHLPRKAKLQALKEVYRVLKPGGKVLFADFGVPVNIRGKISAWLLRKHAFVGDSFKRSLLDDMKTTGFKNIVVKTIQLGILYHILAKK